MGMHYVGVDLAWGQERPSGVAVVDGDGCLVHVSARKDDASIVAVLTPYSPEPCLVAIDAPLIVPNATGSRRCEADLNKDFARFEAGAHPANTSRREFAQGLRGAQLAKTLGLDIDPESQRRARAIEVYPHPATVALFRLDRTLKYKNRPGRTLAQMRSELLRLAGLIQSLKDTPLPLRVEDHPQWKELVRDVESATSKADLRRAEDPVDAVVCAYVAMIFDRRRDQTKTYGDLDSGYIVTPKLPPDHRPVRGTPRLRDPVRQAVQTYAAMYPELCAATDTFAGLVTTLLDDAGVNYLSVTGRAKSVASFAAKADRVVDGQPLYADPLADITDLIGLRVITYLHRDVSTVADLLRSQLTLLDDRDLGQETASEGRFGYASRHLDVAVDPARYDGPALAALAGRRAQVQVRTVLQHAWAEFEHAIRYKGTIPAEDASDLDRRFTLAAGLLELADREFSLIHERIQATAAERLPEQDSGDPRIAAGDLATFLGGQFVDAGWSRTDHYAWISGLLLELGVTSLDELAGLLTSVDSAAINARMEYRYPPGAVRRLDDALLAIFGDHYLGLHGNAHRKDLLRVRLDKLRAPTPDGPGQE
jgi:predicted RNase H-like nuclease/ppGpp synthetase/RelA/SpoT-type nucleotidyltranferase